MSEGGRRALRTVHIFNPLMHIISLGRVQGREFSLHITGNVQCTQALVRECAEESRGDASLGKDSPSARFALLYVEEKSGSSGRR